MIIQKNRNTMQIIQVILLLNAMGMVMAPTSATIFIGDGTEIKEETLPERIAEDAPEYTEESVVFFYDPECGSCIPAHEYLTTYIEEHPGPTIEMMNVSNNQGEEKRLNDLLHDYNREWMNIPVMFIGPVALEGTDEIINGFEEVMHGVPERDRMIQVSRIHSL